MRITRYILFIIAFLFLAEVLFAQSDVVVYVTKTGAKYHKAGCSYLRKSSIPINLSEAVKSYTPCSRCNPPSLSSARGNNIPPPPIFESDTNKRITKDKVVGITPTGKTIYQGPRGGLYHYSKSGKKVYHKKKK